MGYYLNPRAQSLPRALSLLLSCQMAIGLAPAVLAQDASSETSGQAAAPSWNDTNDLMVLPKSGQSEPAKPVLRPAIKTEPVANPVEDKATSTGEAAAVSAEPVESKATAAEHKASEAQARAAEAKAKLDAKKAEEKAIADAKAEAARTKAEAARLEAEKAVELKAEAAKAKLEARKLEEEKQEQLRQSARLKAEESKKSSDTHKADLDKTEKDRVEQKSDAGSANKSLAEAHIAPVETSDQADLGVLKQQTDKSNLSDTSTHAAPVAPVAPLAQPAASEEMVEIVDTDKPTAGDTRPVDSGTTVEQARSSEPTTSETAVIEQPAGASDVASTTTVTTTTATTPGGLPAGSILNPDATSLMASPEAPQVGQPIPEQPGAMTTADGLDLETTHQLGATINEVTTSAAAIAGSDGEVPILDADEQEEVERVVEYENLPTDEGKTRIKTGAKFPVVVLTQLSSKTARNGDPIEARLKYDLKIGDRLVAKKGATVRGHINYALKARSVMHSLVSPTRWYRNSGVLGVEFDEIITDKGEHLPLVATPAKTARVVNNKAEGRLLGVNHEGQVTGPWSQQLKYKAVRVGLNAAMGPIGVFSFGAMPVALGLIGAANPSFAFMKPVGTNVRHRRIKGFAWGFLSGVPGSFLIEDTVTKGQEAIIKPGDEFLAEFRQEFTGEAASEAQLMPNAQTKVKGDVRTKDKKKDSKK